MSKEDEKRYKNEAEALAAKRSSKSGPNVRIEPSSSSAPGEIVTQPAACLFLDLMKRPEILPGNNDEDKQTEIHSSSSSGAIFWVHIYFTSASDPFGNFLGRKGNDKDSKKTREAEPKNKDDDEVSEVEKQVVKYQKKYLKYNPQKQEKKKTKMLYLLDQLKSYLEGIFLEMKTKFEKAKDTDKTKLAKKLKSKKQEELDPDGTIPAMELIMAEVKVDEVKASAKEILDIWNDIQREIQDIYSSSK
jgi:hypothetical protein